METVRRWNFAPLVGFALFTCVCIGITVTILADVFTHGLFADARTPLTLSAVATEKSPETFIADFAASKKHLEGFQIQLDCPSSNSNIQGSCTVRVLCDGETIPGGNFDIPVQSLVNRPFYLIPDTDLDSQVDYEISVTPPHGFSISPSQVSLLPVYAASTFNAAEKLALTFTIFTAWLVALTLWPSITTNGTFVPKAVKPLSNYLVMVVLFTWSFQFNVFGSDDAKFDSFQADSQSLVTGPILAQYNGFESHEYGLGGITNDDGTLLLWDDYWSGAKRLGRDYSEEGFNGNFSK